jgi:hypothetical protein
MEEDDGFALQQAMCGYGKKDLLLRGRIRPHYGMAHTRNAVLNLQSYGIKTLSGQQEFTSTLAYDSK